MVLDVMLPGKDGFEVRRELREAKNYVPVLMLTARGRPEDVLRGIRGRGGRLSAETVRAADFSGAAAGFVAAAANGCARRREARRGKELRRAERSATAPAAED